MNEEPINASSRRSNSSGGLATLFESRRGKMFGVAEIIALTISSFILLVVVLSYLYFLLPARSRLQSLKDDRVQLQTNLKKSKTILEKDQTVQQKKDRLEKSLEHFESVGLVDAAQGRMELYEDLNKLLVKNGLRNTSGPTYAALDSSDTKTPGKNTSTRWESVYPGIAVDVTVEGPYQNIRHFISDIENSKQFLIINQVELQRATQNNSSTDAATQVPAENSTGSRSSLVSLQLNMTTYFQRAAGSQE
ncbi:MAG: hypothetical protein C5B55_00705 [Blastocatellia bacterium]|nr:MAG: hypothetical protein C5B55_00705 [Blastocatellia bacterium]